MKLYKLGLGADQTLQEKTLLTLKTAIETVQYVKPDKSPCAGYQFIASAPNSPFCLLCDNGAISCNISPLSASKMLSLVSRGCSRDFGGGRGSPSSSSVACCQSPWRTHFFATALGPEVSPVVGSYVTQLSPAFGCCSSCSVEFSTQPETVQTRRQYSNI